MGITVEPSVAPSEPQQPNKQDGVQVWVVVIASMAALVVGFIGGFLAKGFGKKK